MMMKKKVSTDTLYRVVIVSFLYGQW